MEISKEQALAYLKSDLDLVIGWERNSNIPQSMRHALERCYQSTLVLLDQKQVKCVKRTVSCPQCSTAVWFIDAPKAYDFEATSNSPTPLTPTPPTYQ